MAPYPDIGKGNKALRQVRLSCLVSDISLLIRLYYAIRLTFGFFMGKIGDSSDEHNNFEAFIYTILFVFEH